MKTNKTKAIIATIAFLFAATANATTTFNANLTSDEKKRIDNGEVVIVNTGNTKKICLETDNKAAKELISTMKALKPAYFAEVIQVKPYKGNENLLEKIKAELLNVEGYAGIPYYSVRHDKWYNLYEWAKILNKDFSNPQNSKMTADVYMKPFGEFQADITLEEKGSELLYMFTNKTKMILEEKITAAGPNKMKSGIVVFRDGDNWILYGAGGVDAISLFFLRDRIETSFINRIKSFTVYFIKQVDKTN